MQQLRYINQRDEKQLLQLLNNLLQDVEDEIVEFKEAASNFDLNKLGYYVSAISNEANLKNKQYGWLIFGVKDKPRKIVGTNYKNTAESLEKLKLEIANSTTDGLSFMDIFVVHPLVNGNVKRVLMFQIPAAAVGIPTGWKNKYYARNGESLSNLTQEKIDRIRKEDKRDWSKEIISDSSIDNLDEEAIKVARRQVDSYLGDTKTREIYKSLSDEEFLAKLRLIINGKLTNAAFVLLGKATSSYLMEYPPSIMWRLHGAKGNIVSCEIFEIPFITAVDRVYKKIRNLNYKYLPNQLTLFPTETQQYDPWAIRELLINWSAKNVTIFKKKIK